MDTDDAIVAPKRANSARGGKAKNPFAIAMAETLRRIADGSEKDPVGAAKKVLELKFGPRRLQTAQTAQRVDNSEALSHPKYAGIANLDKEEFLLRNAEVFADRIKLDSDHLDFLYRASRHTPLPSRRAWEREVRVANAIEHITHIFFKGMYFGNFDFLFDQAAVEAAFRPLEERRATIVMTFHGAFLKLALKLFAKRYFAGGSRDVYLLNLASDPRGGLFGALRTLQSGGMTFMAPDGGLGKTSMALRVLGKGARVGDGAAFLAHTSGCRTAWYTVVRQGDYFAPVVEFGPTREPKETLDEFKSRLSLFYASKIEAIATGDPRNIVFPRRWAKILSDRASL